MADLLLIPEAAWNEARRRAEVINDDAASVLIDMALTMELPVYVGRSQARRDGLRWTPIFGQLAMRGSRSYKWHNHRSIT
jgi:hypothetical protein